MDLMTPDQLQVGDVLLHEYGDSELCRLVAWCTGGRYSHAAIYIGDRLLSEASGEGVRSFELGKRMTPQPNAGGRNPVLQRLDVYRPLALRTDQHAGVIAAAASFSGAPYPMARLHELGLILAVRTYLPQDPLQRALLQMIVNSLERAHPEQQVCSEHVYRVLQKVSLAPEIEIPTTPQPWVDPKIDWAKLALEYLQELQAAGQAPGVEQDQHDRIGALLPDHDPAPNPRFITPEDLARSPSLTFVGSLLQNN